MFSFCLSWFWFTYKYNDFFIIKSIGDKIFRPNRYISCTSRVVPEICRIGVELSKKNGMGNLKTEFAGLELRNPIIVSSSNLTDTAEGCRRFEDAGAAAVVLKSLFEESIMRRTEHLTDETAHAESADYLQGYLRAQMLREYLDLVNDAKRLCSIPVIASICCRSTGEWTEFASHIERAGADALELNVMGLCTAKDYADGEFERRHTEILAAVRRVVGIPIIMKLGANISNPVNLIERLHGYGAAAVVLFNRPYQTDIDIERVEYASGRVLSHPSELANSLRWTGIASSAVKNISFGVSGGVHNGAAIVKSLLAGASAVEVCTALYTDGAEWIAEALEVVSEWQSRHGFATVEEFRGRLDARDPEHADILERTQFLKYFEAFRM